MDFVEREVLRKDRKRLKGMDDDLYRKMDAMDIAIVVLAILLAVSILICVSVSSAEEKTAAYCTATVLNCRQEHTKRSEIVSRLERGEEVDLTGRTYPGWVEAYGSEWGTMWIKAEHITERPDGIPHQYKNTSGGKVLVRNWIEGKVVDSVKAGKTVTVKAELFGWGCIGENKWINLYYFEEID